MMIGKLTTVGIQCTDFAKSKQFYTETLGMKVIAGGEGWATVDAGGPCIALWQGPVAAIVPGFDGAVLEEVRTALAAKGVDVGQLEPHPGGVHYNVTDPDGNRVMLAGS